MGVEITFEKKIDQEELVKLLRNITCRGLYDKEGNNLKPYKDAVFTLVKVHPPENPTSSPMVMHNMQPHPLFTAQPTIYKTQTDMLSEVNTFLQSINKKIHTLGFEGIQYNWKGRGMFHILPPIIEKHTYYLQKGSLDIKKLCVRFNGACVKDAKGNLHEIGKGVIRKYYVDQESKIEYLDVFNPNVELINYGLSFSGESNFYIICDGAHRMDYALELLNEPISSLVVEGASLPYYALPMPFRPVTRLTSKSAEKKYPLLERDKVHLFNDFIKKSLHYDWESGGLHVSKLRGNATVY